MTHTYHAMFYHENKMKVSIVINKIQEHKLCHKRHVIM